MTTFETLFWAAMSARRLAHTDTANRKRHFARAVYWLRWARDERYRHG